MAETQTTYPDTVPLPPLSRPTEVAELLVGAVDLHCHSGPAAMPRILDHHEELVDAAAAGSLRWASPPPRRRPWGRI